MTNAVKYGASDKPITVSIKNDNEKVILQVHNFGNPISPENREEIFNFLNRLDCESGSELQSWGIGLTFVKMAAEAHGGHVELESDEEKGTTFSVILPKHSNKPGKRRAMLNFQ
ncbi:ATP-binding protein [Antarcticibacterium sp. 1MA-6-2]|nr:ATP-binding protein [Antarcticibacterium sp. 1MA-6-2]